MTAFGVRHLSIYFLISILSVLTSQLRRENDEHQHHAQSETEDHAEEERRTLAIDNNQCTAGGHANLRDIKILRRALPLCISIASAFVLQELME